ncbi:MAG: FtsW/RodA/SpoVE family cell cycle protein [Bdellovibrionales bacterium]
MRAVSRNDQTIIGHWWWTVDHWTLLALVALIGFGVLLIQAATPAIAVKHGLSTFYFVKRHLFMLLPSLIIIFGTSLLSPRQVRLLTLGLLFLFLPLLGATLFFGEEIKGATRWIQFAGLSMQPSEFIKPVFAVVAAWLFSRHCEHRSTPGMGTNICLFMLIVFLLLKQPDIGMTVLFATIWLTQFFLAGMPLALAWSLPLLGTISLCGAYYAFPHFASRFDRFLTTDGDNYQIDKALEAFTHGGLFGTGPGAGTVKMKIPDVHADFIFAVAGEELGLVGAGIIIALFAFIVLRGIWLMRKEKNLFVLLAVSGLLIEFGIQTIINLGSTLHLLPAKGMTLPFISYGGSSLLALSLQMGMLLSLTRKRYGSAEV